MTKNNFVFRLLDSKIAVALCLATLLLLSACNSRDTDEEPTTQEQQEQVDDSSDQGSDESVGNEQTGDTDPNSDTEDETAEPEPADNQEDSSDQTDQTDQPVEDTSNAADDNTSDDSAAGKVQNDGRIEFDAGTTGTTVTGEIEAGALNSYVLQVAEGQIMTVVLNGPEGTEFGVSDSEGTLFEPGVIPLSAYTSQPLQGGDVTITVGSQTSGSYELTVEVVDEYTLADKGRIEFDAGATSKTIGGRFSGTTLDTYTIGAAAGQVMTIIFSGPPNSMFSVSNSTDGTTIFNPTKPVSTAAIGPLPDTGDYVINAGPSYLGYYELTVTIIDLDQAESLPDGVRVNSILNPLGNAWLIFKGNSEGGSLIQVDGVDIYNLDTGRLHQTLNFRSETPVPVEPPSLVIADVNFDGYTDLGIPLFTTAGTNLPLSYFLWDPTVNQFVRNDNFDVLMAPTFLEDKRILTRARAGAGDVYYEVFRIGKSGPISVARQSCEVKPDDSGEIVIQNIGVTIDNAGLETQVFNELSTEGCLPFKVVP